MQPTVSIQFTKMLLTYCSELGLDIRHLTQSVALDSSVLDDPEERIAYPVFNTLFSEAEKQSGLQNFGLHLGERATDYSGGHILVSMMQSCASIEDAMERLLRYHSLASDAFSFSIEQQGTRTVVTLREDPLIPCLSPSQVEQIFSMLVLILASISGQQVRPCDIFFRHRRPGETSLYKKIFGDCVSFGKRDDQIRLVTENLKLPLPMFDPAFRTAIEQIVNKRLKSISTATSWTARAERQLYRSLTNGDAPDFDTLAKKLSMSRKTLRRALKNEGTTFKHLLDRVRKEMAQALLDQPDMSLFNVALLLGYAEQSTFNHAFRRWTGMSPNDFRKAQAANKSKR